ncbi:MAG: hypothetical protein ABSG65_34625 [Bryobacteraceae bacterium]|jgi:hypothetical protein
MTTFMYLGIPISVTLIVLAAVYRNWIWRNTDTLTKWLQIAALIVAGYWAYTRFSIADAPSLERIVTVGGQLGRLPSPIPNTCILTYLVVVKNEGLVSFDVKSVHIRAWPFVLEKPGPGQAAYVDVNEAQKARPIVNASLETPYLEGHYTPKTVHDETLSWILDAPTSSSYLFAADVTGPDGKVLGGTRQFQLGICADTVPNAAGSSRRTP